MPMWKSHRRASDLAACSSRISLDLLLGFEGTTTRQQEAKEHRSVSAPVLEMWHARHGGHELEHDGPCYAATRDELSASRRGSVTARGGRGRRLGG